MVCVCTPYYFEGENIWCLSILYMTYKRYLIHRVHILIIL